MRTIRYQQIADELRARLAAGEYAPGRLLPSEAELSSEFDASRVTVRRALELLRESGLVDARQGFGWFGAFGGRVFMPCSGPPPGGANPPPPRGAP